MKGRICYFLEILTSIDISLTLFRFSPELNSPKPTFLEKLARKKKVEPNKLKEKHSDIVHFLSSDMP